MWNVKSDQGKLRAVLVHDASYRAFYMNLVLPSMSKNTQGAKSAEQLRTLYKYLREEGVRVFELGEIIKGIVEKATIQEKKEIIDRIWLKEAQKPTPEELEYEHILWGYPNELTWDEENEKIILPDCYWRPRFGIYARDPSFGTPIGHVISKMRRRINEPRVVKLGLEMDPVLSENVKIIYDQEQDPEAKLLEGATEGGDHIVVDQETIAIGVGQRSNFSGFLPYMKTMFDRDVDKQLKHIVAVKMPGETSISHSHLDTSINFVDKGKILVQPYIHDSDIVDIFPEKKLLGILVQNYREQLEKNYQRQKMGSLYTAKTFKTSGEAHIYARDSNGVPKRVVEKNFVDWLIKTEKVEKDGIILVAGEPKEKVDLWHLIYAQQEQWRQAPNIVALKPGYIIAYQENWRTIENLRSHGIRVKELPHFHLDMGGGPHCLTCPLQRDPV